jgi:hypothetical protein
MGNRKLKSTKTASSRRRETRQSEAAISQHLWVTGPTLRKALNISPVTLWRWRHNPGMASPAAKRINGRNFFAWNEVTAWLKNQPIAT